MRNSRLALLVIVVLLATDVTLANLPGPVPTSSAILNAENSPSFKAVVGNGTYSYYRYSGDPTYDTGCIRSGFDEFAHRLNPFHQYMTTTLIFQVQPTPPTKPPFLAFVQIDPASGHVFSIETTVPCA